MRKLASKCAAGKPERKKKINCSSVRAASREDVLEDGRNGTRGTETAGDPKQRREKERVTERAAGGDERVNVSRDS